MTVRTFQDLILALQGFWAERGCLIVQPYNSEVGAGTYNPATFLRALGPRAVERRATSSRRAAPPTAATATTRTACSSSTSSR